MPAEGALRFVQYICLSRSTYEIVVFFRFSLSSSLNVFRDGKCYVGSCEPFASLMLFLSFSFVVVVVVFFVVVLEYFASVTLRCDAAVPTFPLNVYMNYSNIIKISGALSMNSEEIASAGRYRGPADLNEQNAR